MSSSSNNHLDRISITITLAPAPASQTSFGTMMFIADEASGTDLDGDRVRTYASASEVSTDVDAGHVSAALGQMASDFFSQRPQPTTLKIGRADTGGGESFEDAFDAIRAVDDDFYGVAIESRVDADILSISSAVESSDSKIVAVQSDDSDWLTTGLPSGLSALATRENTAVLYHDTDAEWGAVCWLGARLQYNPDRTAAGFSGRVKAVANYSTAPTAGQKQFLVANNANYGLPYGSEPFTVFPGVNCAGREIAHILTKHWLRDRVQTDLIATHLAYMNRGEKLTVSREGQAVCAAIVRGWFQRGEAVGHFKPGNTEVTLPEITTTDINNREIPLTARATLATSAVQFDFTINTSTTDLE